MLKRSHRDVRRFRIQNIWQAVAIIEAKRLRPDCKDYATLNRMASEFLRHWGVLK